MAIDLRSSDLQDNFIQERIDNVEKHVSEMCTQLAAYTRKVARVRDAGDELAKTVLNFAIKENLNLTLRTALTRFSDILSGIQDYREAQVQRLEAKVVNELTTYGRICKQAKEELKHSFSARARELNKRHQLEKLRGRKPTNWQQIAQAENELHRATTEATEATKILEQQIDAFEKRKLDDIKRVFLEFIKIELLFHSKSLELYTKAYKNIADIKEEEDLEVFRNCLRTPVVASRLEMVRSAMASSVFVESPVHSDAPVTSGILSHRNKHSRNISEPALKSSSLSSPNQKNRFVDSEFSHQVNVEQGSSVSDEQDDGTDESERRATPKILQWR